MFCFQPCYQTIEILNTNKAPEIQSHSAGSTEQTAHYTQSTSPPEKSDHIITIFMFSHLKINFML
jgi:hypothetical protein